MIMQYLCAKESKYRKWLKRRKCFPSKICCKKVFKICPKCPWFSTNAPFPLINSSYITWVILVMFAGHSLTFCLLVRLAFHDLKISHPSAKHPGKFKIFFDIQRKTIEIKIIKKIKFYPSSYLSPLPHSFPTKIKFKKSKDFRIFHSFSKNALLFGERGRGRGVWKPQKSSDLELLVSARKPAAGATNHQTVGWSESIDNHW